MENDSKTINTIDNFYEELKNKVDIAIILLYIQNYLYNITKFDKITGDEIYSSLDDILYKTQLLIHDKDKPINDFLSIITCYVEKSSYYLMNHPNSSIVRNYEYIHFGLAREIDSKSIQKLATKPGRNVKEKLASDPRLYAVKKEYSYDVIENRVLKEFLYNLKRYFEMKFVASIQTSKEYEFYTQINNFLKSSIALSIGDYKTTKVNNVLSKDKHYKKIWKSWSKLKDLDLLIDNLHKHLHQNIITYMYYNIVSILSRSENYYTIQKAFKSDFNDLTEKNIKQENIKIYNKSTNKPLDFKIENNILIFNDSHIEVIIGIKDNQLTVVKNMLSTDIIEAGNQKFQKSYAIISKTYNITYYHIYHRIKELYEYITNNKEFNMDTTLEPINKPNNDMVYLDVCSNKMLYSCNQEIKELPFRMLIQKDKNDNILDCKTSKAISGEYEAIDMVELFCKEDKEDNLKFYAKEIFFNNLKEYLNTNNILYILPDTLDTLKIFDTKDIISHINFTFNSCIRLPRSIASILGENVEKDITFYFIDFVYGSPYITKVKSIYSEELEKYIKATKGICYERHYTKEIKEFQQEYNHYNNLIIWQDNKILPSDKVELVELDYNIIKKYINEFDPKKDIILCNNVKIKTSEKIQIKEVNIEQMIENCYKFYDYYSHLQDKNISIWYDYLPQLSMTCIKDSCYHNLELVGKGQKINPYGKLEKIEIKEIFEIPEDEKEIKFPLVMDKNLISYEALIKIEKPLDNRKCNLILEYSYGEEEPYKLYFIRKDNENKLEVEWNKTIIESKRPEYPKIISWDDVYDFPLKDGNDNLSKLLIEAISHPNFTNLGIPNPPYKRKQAIKKQKKWVRFLFYKIWSNGKSIYDKECNKEFREKIKDFFSDCENGEYNYYYFDFIVFLTHKDMPKAYQEKLKKQLQVDILESEEEIDHNKYVPIGHALGDISQPWQEDILKEITNVNMETCNQYVLKVLLRILSIAIWGTNNNHNKLYDIFKDNIDRLISNNIYEIIKEEFKILKDSLNNNQVDRDMFRSLLNMYDLLFGILLYRDNKKYPDMTNILHPTNEAMSKYIEQLDEIWKWIVNKCGNFDASSLNSYIDFNIDNMPKAFKDKNVPKLLFVIRAYLTGNFSGSNITIKGFNN